jgi:putative exosortase-associated protein (TIGR04073 family)
MNRFVVIVMLAAFAVVALCGESMAEPCANCAKPCSKPGAPCPNPCLSAMGEKFMRGATNLATGWVEIPAQVCKGYRRGCFYGAFLGLFKGIWYGAGRTVNGAYDMVGFWLASPESYEGVGIPFDAEYAWEEGCPYSLNDPRISKATIEPIGRKLARGLGNAGFAILEWPAQIKKCMHRNAWDFGVGKALWSSFSREYDGIMEAATCALPNPCTTKGVKFDDEWPWTALDLQK